MTELIEILQTLSDAPGVSGDEGEVRKSLRALLTGPAITTHVDALGNLFAIKPGTGPSSMRTSKMRVLVSAHMDEVGFMVVDHTGDGELRVESIGGITPTVLPGTRVLVGKDSLPGVIGVKAIHRIEGDGDGVPAIRSLAIDIGASGRDEAARVAPLGTSVVFATRFNDLGRSVSGKAFDDRAGCALLLALLQGDPFPFELCAAFTVQEEVGLRGAGVAAYALNPDVALTLEGTLADDLPKEEKDVSPTTELGKGPAITVMDRSYTTPPRLLQHFIETAEARQIPYQFKQPGIGGTDSGSIHRARAGVPAITVAVPCRYIHGPVSMLRRSDLDHTLHLVRAALETLTPDVLQRG